MAAWSPARWERLGDPGENAPVIPIGDEDTGGRAGIPFVNLAIIAINIVVFFYQLADPNFTNGYAAVPAEITSGTDIIGTFEVVTPDGAFEIEEAPGPAPIWLTLFSSMFMHGGWLHIGSNMLFLFIFGDNVEDNMGPIKYLIFYLLCGFGADFLQILLGAGYSVIPNLGASGAIAGVLAAYLVLFPQARIRALIPLGFFSSISLVPAMLMIGFWIVMQFVSVFFAGEQAAGEGGGVAYWAHIGGFIFGLLLVFVLRGRSEGGSPMFAGR